MAAAWRENIGGSIAHGGSSYIAGIGAAARGSAAASAAAHHRRINIESRSGSSRWRIIAAPHLSVAKRIGSSTAASRVVNSAAASACCVMALAARRIALSGISVEMAAAKISAWQPRIWRSAAALGISWPRRQLRGSAARQRGIGAHRARRKHRHRRRGGAAAHRRVSVAARRNAYRHRWRAARIAGGGAHGVGLFRIIGGGGGSGVMAAAQASAASRHRSSNGGGVATAARSAAAAA